MADLGFEFLGGKERGRREREGERGGEREGERERGKERGGGRDYLGLFSSLVSLVW